MTFCTHTICRFAKSDELLRQAVRAAREGDRLSSDKLLDEVRAAHFDDVLCRMAEPKAQASRQASLALETEDPQFQGVRA